MLAEPSVEGFDLACLDGLDESGTPTYSFSMFIPMGLVVIVCSELPREKEGASEPVDR